MSVPSIVLEQDGWVLLFKPHGIPSAPLSEGEEGTLLDWFLNERPDAGCVKGKKKAIERGLLHRLDTGTEGLVLVATSQNAYDRLYDFQVNGMITKNYFAFCLACKSSTPGQIDHTPFIVRSRFRAFGPGRREVRPLFPGMRGYEKTKTEYETVIEKIERFCDTGMIGIHCRLVRGYRHQIRSHLAHLGYPIVADALYNTLSPTFGDVPLQLYAPGISFPDPFSRARVSFSLPIPDKMTQ